MVLQDGLAVTAVPTRFARGWHCLGLVRDFADGKPHAVEAFGTKLVVFGDSSGDLHVLDAYCPHMGGDLSRGSVKDDAVACPFHDWRWNGLGQCVSVPYARRIPKRARTGSWFSCRQSGLFFVWHDPEGNPPPDEVAIPRIDEVDSDEWSDWSWDSWLVQSHSREVVENLVDSSHFFYVHDGFPTEFKNVFDGHVAEQHLTSRGRPDSDLGPEYGNSVAHSRSSYFGPAYVVTHLNNDFNGFVTEAVLVACHYPVTHDSFILQSGILAKNPPGVDSELAEGFMALIVAGVNDGFAQDIAMFENKARVDNPLLCDEDGPVYQLRRWYEQFYVDQADVTAEMTERREYAVDLGYSGEVWSRQVIANLARRNGSTADASART